MVVVSLIVIAIVLIVFGLCYTGRGAGLSGKGPFGGAGVVNQRLHLCTNEHHHLRGPETGGQSRRPSPETGTDAVGKPNHHQPALTGPKRPRKPNKCPPGEDNPVIC